MEYTVTYRTHAMSNGNLHIDAYIYKTGSSEYDAVISNTISPPTWVERKVFRVTFEGKIDEAKEVLEESIARYIKSKTNKRDLEKAVSEYLNDGKIEGAVIDKNYNPQRTTIGFNTTPLTRDRPAVMPPSAKPLR